MTDGTFFEFTLGNVLTLIISLSAVGGVVWRAITWIDKKNTARAEKLAREAYERAAQLARDNDERNKKLAYETRMKSSFDDRRSAEIRDARNLQVSNITTDINRIQEDILDLFEKCCDEDITPKRKDFERRRKRRIEDQLAVDRAYLGAVDEPEEDVYTGKKSPF